MQEQQDLNPLGIKASFIDAAGEYGSLSRIPSVDGFIMETDALLKVSSEQRWFLQVNIEVYDQHIHFSNNKVNYILNECYDCIIHITFIILQLCS